MQTTNVASQPLDKSWNPTITAALITVLWTTSAHCDAPAQSVRLWSGHAPGETSAELGTQLDKGDSITRIKNTTAPTLDVFLAEHPNGTAVVVLPGGGFGYVVTDLEGSEAAAFLNAMGVSVFVLRYRTGDNQRDNVWQKPVQDAQRAIRTIRANASKWSIDQDRVGVLGFSAGGQASAFLLTAKEAMYESTDPIDENLWCPNFGTLVYPWRLLNESGRLKHGIEVTESTPKTIIIHTHDDPAADSLGSVAFDTKLKKHNVDAELHIYRTGGHGYGLRRREDSVIDQWPAIVSDWLRLQGLASASK
ncbi:Acetylxylan esterase precursor [Rubripirellula tenax]|uniref:Acetylxylan esterase n=1 Tax=Rubripirellula tenax TaxID=2528015 RepID=A0A5C6DYC1_9BACT|nr:alpha/beta hydrolase [Rubripirellula tenax]TWU41700.1 Acetylxylan esterase precursor [Rubripirellula tenax]